MTDTTDPINKVITEIEQVIRWSKAHQSRLGFFGALYLRVTTTIRSKIGTGYFDDDERMERLDEAFANRYLKVANDYQQGNTDLPAAWAVAMNELDNDKLIIVQHLLLAMNPHINIDLGAAAAEVAPGDKIHALKDDFMKINDVLAQLVPTVIDEIDELSPLIHLLSDIAEPLEDAIINFSMDIARDAAWAFALKLAPLPPQERQAAIDQRNQPIARLGNFIANPGFVLNEVVEIIHVPETKDILTIIDVLDSGNPFFPIPGGGKTANPDTAPNRIYYFDVAPGNWGGKFNFQLKSWKALWSSDIGIVDKLLVAAMALWQKILGSPAIHSTITPSPDEGSFGVARNDFLVSAGWFKLFHSSESYTLSPDGTGVTVDAHVQFGPIPLFLFKEHDVYTASIFDHGHRAFYHVKLLNTRFAGHYQVQADGNEVDSVLENEIAIAQETLVRSSS